MGNYLRVRRWDEKEPNMDMRPHSKNYKPVETLYKELVVFTGETSVQYLYNERVHGVSPSGKHFFKFQTPRKVIYTIKPNKYGEMVGKFYLKEGRSFTNVTNRLQYTLNRMVGRYTNSFVGMDVFAAQVRKIAQAHAINVDETISIFDPAFTYPVLRHLEAPLDAAYPGAITRYAATNDLGDFVRRAFGTTRYRKDLVKAVANLSSMPIFMAGWSFRGLVPIDWIIGFYQKYAHKNVKLFAHDTFVDGVRQYLHKLPEKQVRKLFRILESPERSANWNTLRDLFVSLAAMKTHDLYEGVETLKFTSITEAHDKFATFVRLAETKKKNAEYLLPLEPTDLAQQILDIEYPENADVRIKPASCAMELVSWGAMMNHCIGSYTRDAISHGGTFGAILHHGKVIGNFHYDHRSERMFQIFGKHNKSLDTDILVAVFSLLIENTKVKYSDLSHIYGASHVYSDPRLEKYRRAEIVETQMKAAAQMPMPNNAVMVGPAGQAIDGMDWQPIGYINGQRVDNVREAW